MVSEGVLLEANFSISPLQMENVEWTYNLAQDCQIFKI